MSTTKQVEKQLSYVVYRSSVPNHNIIMKSGKVLHIINNEYITNNSEEIEFLDKEIESGFIYIKKVGNITTAARDPMQALKDKIIAEYEAKKAAESKNSVPVIGDSDTGKIVARTLSPGSTAILEKLAAGSGV